MHGLANLQFVAELRLLRAVEPRALGESKPSIRDPADELSVGQPTADRAVSEATADSYLARFDSDVDRRRCQHELTEYGRESLDETTVRSRKPLVGWYSKVNLTLTDSLNRLADDLDAQTQL